VPAVVAGVSPAIVVAVLDLKHRTQ